MISNEWWKEQQEMRSLSHTQFWQKFLESRGITTNYINLQNRRINEIFLVKVNFHIFYPVFPNVCMYYSYYTLSLEKIRQII